MGSLLLLRFQPQAIFSCGSVMVGEGLEKLLPRRGCSSFADLYMSKLSFFPSHSLSLCMVLGAAVRDRLRAGQSACWSPSRAAQLQLTQEKRGRAARFAQVRASLTGAASSRGLGGGRAPDGG